MNTQPKIADLPIHRISRSRKWSGLIVLLLLSSLSAYAIHRVSPHMSSLRDGSATDFWEAVCPSLWPPEYLGGLRVHGIRNGDFIYEDCHQHGSVLYWVSNVDVSSQLDQALVRIEAAVKKGAVHVDVKVGFASWQHSEAGRAKDVAELVKSIEQARYTRTRKSDPDLYQIFKNLKADRIDRLHRADYFWATQLFEWLFFTGLSSLIVWAVFWTRRNWLRALLVAPIPLLFVLPLYLGYSSYTFTSHGPAGGIVYPWLVRGFRMELTSWDHALLDDLPLILEPLSTSIGSPMSLSFIGFPSLTTAIAVGIGLGLVVYFWPKMWRRVLTDLRKRNVGEHPDSLNIRKSN